MDEASLSVAAVGRPIIKRPRLTRLLDEAQTRVTMLVAPAGYGKTTLAYEWLGDRDGPSAWHACSPASADVAALALGVADAAATIVPGAADRLRTRLRVTNAPESEVDILAELLAEDVSAWPDDAWLCLDDYQFAIESAASERLIERVLELSPIRLLVASRERPTWATPRRILYGELTEIGTSALAMTGDEAITVLSERRTSRALGLLALADGWPAVIGLAAMLPELEIRDERLPAPLYDYIAEELYQSADADLQRRLPEVAIAPSLSVELLDHLFGDDSSRVLEEAVRVGFIARRSDGTLDLHPLLRTFLESKLRYENIELASSIAGRIGLYLLDRKRWDDAFAVASTYRRADILTSLVRASFDEMLAEGRLPTLAHWLAAEAPQKDDPVFQLAEAELDFRTGRYARAQALAAQAADSLGPDDPLTSRAFFRAGQSAYFLDQPDRAIEYFGLARREASTDHDVRQAVWGQFITSADLGQADAKAFLEELAAFPRGTVADSVRQTNARLRWANHTGGIPEAIEEALPFVELLDKVSDPILVTSFLNTVASALVLTAQYREAETTCQTAISVGEKYSLRFVFPHVFVVQASAHLGLGNFGSALRVLRRAEILASEQDDLHSQMNAAALRLRLRTAQGSPDRGLRETDRNWTRLPGPGMYGELLASRALALACLGRSDDARRTGSEAQRTTAQPEARVLALAAHAVVAVQAARSDVAESVRALSEAVSVTGNRDSLVVASRAYPALLPILNEDEGGRMLLEELFTSPDIHAAGAGGVGVTHVATRRMPSLSKREHEVFELLAQGLTNREIGRALFISEVTVKVHVRRVLAKLGVRSRTEAAIIAQDQLADGSGG